MDQRPTAQQQQQQQIAKSYQRQAPSARQELFVRDSSFESHSTDRDEEEEDYEISFLEACMDCDDDALYDIIRDGVTREQVNERDKSGRTGLSHASANGFMPVLDLLGSLDDLDPNLADNDGNTALIYAAQAGHDDVVGFLLQNMRNVRVDQPNKLGFTALMKAAIQGRTRCAKLLLFAGASPNRRDHGRGLCAEEWARFCGCHSCANSIAKYVRSKKYFFKKTFLLSKDKWASEPDILNCSKRGAGTGGEKPSSWIQRHLSLKKKKGRGQPGSKAAANLESGVTNDSLATANKFGSAPILLINSYEEDIDLSAKNFRRPSCIDNVVPVSIGRRRHLPDDCENGDKSNKSLVINSQPSSANINSITTHSNSNDNGDNHDDDHHDDSNTYQSKNSKELQERPPKITVGDHVSDDVDQTGIAFPAIKPSTSTIVAPTIGAFFTGKAVAVVDAVRNKSGRSGSVSVECHQSSSDGSSKLSIHDV